MGPSGGSRSAARVLETACAGAQRPTRVLSLHVLSVSHEVLLKCAPEAGKKAGEGCP